MIDIVRGGVTKIKENIWDNVQDWGGIFSLFWYFLMKIYLFLCLPKDIVQLGPKLQSSGQGLAQSITLCSLWYPPPTHHRKLFEGF